MSKKILLVDDDPGVHVIIVPILSKAGYYALSAKNGEQALQQALNERPELIILDVIMPGIKGRDLCKKIKAYDVLKDIPVIFLTAKDSQDDVEAELQAGAITHLTKPVNPTELLKAIHEIIGPQAGHSVLKVPNVPNVLKPDTRRSSPDTRAGSQELGK